jgi:hypothetical protein
VIEQFRAHVVASTLLLCACAASPALAPADAPSDRAEDRESVVAVDSTSPRPPVVSAFVDPEPPPEWRQCAGFVNTAADDISSDSLDGCLGAERLRVRVFTADNALEEDVAVEELGSLSAWPTHAYVGGRSIIERKTHWGGLDGGAQSVFFASTDGRDACAQTVAPGGTTLGSGHAETAIIAADAIGYDEYRLSCGKQALPDRKIALYR